MEPRWFIVDYIPHFGCTPFVGLIEETKKVLIWLRTQQQFPHQDMLVLAHHPVSSEHDESGAEVEVVVNPDDGVEVTVYGVAGRKQQLRIVGIGWLNTAANAIEAEFAEHAISV